MSNNRVLLYLVLMALLFGGALGLYSLVFNNQSQAEKPDQGLYLYFIMKNEEGNLVAENPEQPFLIADDAMVAVNLVWLCSDGEHICLSWPISAEEVENLAQVHLFAPLPTESP